MKNKYYMRISVWSNEIMVSLTLKFPTFLRKHLFDRNAVKTDVFEFQNSRQELIKTMTVLFILHLHHLAYSDGVN